MVRGQGRKATFCSVITVIGVACLVCASDAWAQRILRVPSEYPTIQAGINAAQANDTVLVAPGDYAGAGNVDLDFLGKAIIVRGENGLARINDSAGGAVAVRFQSGEPSQAVFEGFIIQFDSGAGVVVAASHPTIRNCSVTAERASPLSMTDSDAALVDLAFHGSRADLQVIGGAPTFERVAISGASLAMRGTTVTLTDCSASDNTSGLAYTGGGMSFRNSTATLTRCTIRDNATYGDEGYNSFGGGVYVEDSVVHFDQCLISGNHAYGHLQAVHGEGGGAYVLNSEVRFDSCEFLSNVGDTHGGGAYVEGGSVSFSQCAFRSNSGFIGGGGAFGSGEFEDCQFLSNWGQEWGGGAASKRAVYRRCSFISNSSGQYAYEDNGGGGLWSWSGPTTVIDSLFVRNGAGGEDARGGGMHAQPTDVIRGCTFVSNYAQREGGGISFEGQSATVGNSIIRNNRNASGSDQIYGTASVGWSNVQDGYPGDGNIDADPRFVDPVNGDYRLGDGSPCIDGGNNSLVPPESEFDLDGLPRFVNDPGMPDMGEGTVPIVDMGCYEFQTSSTGLNLALRTSCPDGGPARIGWANASPDRTAVLLISPQTGQVRIPIRYPCSGTELGLAATGLRIAWQGRNDANGGRVINATAPPGGCGQFVQLLDISTCNVSEVVQIE